MDRTHRDDAELGVGTTNDAVLVCASDGDVRADVASTLRQDYPVRTAESESDAVASADGHVNVLVVDVTDDAFDVDRIVEVANDRGYRFQIAVVVDDEPAAAVRDRCDGVVRKPIDGQAVRSTVRLLHRRGRYDEMLGRYYALSEEYAALTTDPEADEAELSSLEERLVQLRGELDDVGDALADEDAFQVALDTDRRPSS